MLRVYVEEILSYHIWHLVRKNRSLVVSCILAGPVTTKRFQILFHFLHPWSCLHHYFDKILSGKKLLPNQFPTINFRVFLLLFINLRSRIVRVILRLFINNRSPRQMAILYRGWNAGLISWIWTWVNSWSSNSSFFINTQVYFFKKFIVEVFNLILFVSKYFLWLFLLIIIILILVKGFRSPVSFMLYFLYLNIVQILEKVFHLLSKHLVLVETFLFNYLPAFV